MEVQNAQKAAQRQSSPMESCSLATILFGFLCMEDRGDRDVSRMPRNTMERWQRKLIQDWTCGSLLAPWREEGGLAPLTEQKWSKEDL